MNLSRALLVATSPIVWVAHFKNRMGSRPRIQRNYYAFLIMVTIMGDARCVGCYAPYVPGDFDVDRIFGNERDDEGSELYRPGSVCYLCKPCNQERSRLQTNGSDWQHVEEYVDLVLAASEVVDVPSVSDALVWWNAREVREHRSRFTGNR